MKLQVGFWQIALTHATPNATDVPNRYINFTRQLLAFLRFITFYDSLVKTFIAPSG